MEHLSIDTMREERDLRAAQDAAIARAATKELIPVGILQRLDFAREQVERANAGLEPLVEEGVLWRYTTPAD